MEKFDYKDICIIDDITEDAHLLVEYQASQNSAQHHDTIIWTITGLTWTFEGVLLNAALSTLRIPMTNNCFLYLLATLGVLTLLYSYSTTSRLRKIRYQKYLRCKIIEKRFGFSQHSKLDSGKSNVGFTFIKLINAIFCLAWLLIAVGVIK